MSRSLVRQVVLRSIAVTIAMLALLLGVLAWRLEHGAAELNRRTLAAQAREIARHLDGAGSALRLALPADLAAAYAEPERGNHYAVLNAKGALLFASPGVTGPLYLIAALAEELGSDEEGPGEAEEDAEPEPTPSYFRQPPGSSAAWLSGGSFPIEREGRRLWIQVTQGSGHADVLIEGFVLEFLEEAGWLLLPGVALLVLVNVLTIRRSFAPLTRLSHAAVRVRPGAAAVGLPTVGLPRELLPLVGAVNLALDRLNAAIRLQRDFIADAAHELRTPLAILEAHLDALPDRAAASELQEDVQRLGRLIGQLLRAAELETLTVGSEERADLRALSLEVARALAPLAIRAGRGVAVTGVEAPVPVRGNADALADAVRNLVENGLRHTAGGTSVEIDIASDPPAIRVRDSGPGIPEAERAQATRRFWRGDRRREGVGLGLAIVARIADAHGAALTIGASPQGGAEVTIEFPPLAPV